MTWYRVGIVGSDDPALEFWFRTSLQDAVQRSGEWARREIAPTAQVELRETVTLPRGAEPF